MDFIDDELVNYVEKHTTAESEVLYDLNRNTNLNVLQPRMLSGHLQGRVLSMISKMIQPQNILEIGTYTGYSAICMAEGLKENGKLYTIDINEELETMAKSYFSKAGVQDKIDFRIGNALEIIPQIDAEFDLVFIDADKHNYINYFNLVIDKVRKGGFIIADNVLWSGKVLKNDDELDEDTKTLKAYNKMIQESDKVENVLLPIRDGLMVARKI